MESHGGMERKVAIGKGLSLVCMCVLSIDTTLFIRFAIFPNPASLTFAD